MSIRFPAVRIFLLTIVTVNYGGTFPACKNQGIMTEVLRKSLLVKHNSLRTLLALGIATLSPTEDRLCKPASKMPLLTYSCELEETAYYRSSECDKLQFSEDYKLTENFATNLTPRKTIENFAKGNVQKWWAEIKSMGQVLDQTQNIYHFGRGIDSFAKIASDLTTAVGCSIVHCGKSYNFVCHYNTTLDEGGILYNTGRACSQCTGDCVNGLCN